MLYCINNYKLFIINKLIRLLIRLTKSSVSSRLRAGDLYLFCPADQTCPSLDCIWGIPDHQIHGHYYMESSSRDLKEFATWHWLPDNYRVCRLATRDELRDYMAALGRADC